MKKNKVLILTTLATTATLGGMVMLTSNHVYAQTDTKYPPIVQKLIEEFDLDTSKIDELLEAEKTEREAQREEMEAKHQQEVENTLTQAVTDGKITEEQKTKILEKLAEMTPNKDNGQKEDLSELTDEERKTKMEQRKSDFEAWETELGIKLSDLGINLMNGKGGPEQGKKFQGATLEENE